jgi:hypothetical protein
MINISLLETIRELYIIVFHSSDHISKKLLTCDFEFLFFEKKKILTQRVAFKRVRFGEGYKS